MADFISYNNLHTIPHTVKAAISYTRMRKKRELFGAKEEKIHFLAQIEYMLVLQVFIEYATDSKTNLRINCECVSLNKSYIERYILN